MKRFSNGCERWRQSICLLASDALSQEHKVEVENHLANCSGCQKYFGEIKRAAAPLTDWEKNFARLEPGHAVQARWAKAIQTAQTNSIHSPAREGFFNDLWCELIWPCRRALAGMAALWLAMWAINSGSFTSQSRVAMAHSPLPPAIWQGIEEQKRLLAELTESKPTQPVEPPRRNNPRPRSDGLAVQKIC